MKQHKMDNSNVKTNKQINTSYGSEHYEMGSRFNKDRKRGRCVILNYKNFIDKKNYPMRKGSEHDVTELRKTFENLNFDVIVHQDMTERLTSFVLRNESQFDHSDYFCFILCILSHGEPNRFMCIDSNSGIPYKFVYEQFNGEKCFTLAGKPKLFFIQACRGEQFDTGVNLANDFGSNNNETDSRLQIKNLSENPYIISISQDQFVFYSCYDGYRAARNAEKGSRFIMHLCSTLDQFADQDDLLTIADKVKNSVSRQLQELLIEANSIGSNSVPVKQMPTSESTLIKKVYF